MITPNDTSTIVSQAFRFMEVTPPSSLADNSPKAADANEQYELALRICLEQEDWSFARRAATLPEANLPDGEGSDPALPYCYILPSDCVKLRAVTVPGARWRIDLGLLRADLGQSMAIRYTALIRKEANLPAVFRTAVAYQLAVLLAPRWLTSRTKRADLISDGGDALRRAMENDRHTASYGRMDGQPIASDWASEALR